MRSLSQKAMEKADGLATEGAMEDEGFSAELGAKSVRSLAVRSKHSLLGGVCKTEELKPQSEETSTCVDEKEGKQGIERNGVPRPV